MDTETRSALSRLQDSFVLLYGARLSRLILFGSQVRGEAAQDSDIDIPVLLRGSVRPGDEILRTGAIVADLSLQISEGQRELIEEARDSIAAAKL